MQKLKLKDYLQTMAHNKIFDIEGHIFDNYMLVSTVETTEKPFEE